MSKMNTNQQLSAINVYLERKKSREFVGQLTKTKIDGKTNFEFRYDQSYLLKTNSIPLGPEFPLSKEFFNSRKLFQSFEDRIPSKMNPAYPEYCKTFGISKDESDVFILLSTIARKGPSSFIFEGTPSQNQMQSVLEYRRRLGLTVRDFSALFDISTASLQKLEQGKTKGSELMKRLQIYFDFPEVALWEINRNKAKIHDNKYREILEKFADQTGGKL